jgi:trans-aconitate methyltransferase
MDKNVRTHDLLYLLENRYEKPKQLHLEIIELIANFFETNEIHRSVTILDAGCAAGEFAYQIHKRFPAFKTTAFDLLPVLVDKARQNVPGVNFFEADILDKSSVELNYADIVTCSGVLSIFDDFTHPLNNLISWVKPKGKLFLHSLFSEYPFDVRIRYNASEDYGKGILETGWNIFSKTTMSDYLTILQEKRVIKNFLFHDFHLRVHLERQPDMIRSWTFVDGSGRNVLTNGLMILQPHAILEVTKA